MIWVWGGGLACSLLVVVLIVATIILGNKQEEKRKRVLEQGTPVKCWIVMHNDALDTPSDSDSYSYAQVVFTVKQDLPNLDARLADLAEKVANFTAPPNPPENERIIAGINRTHIPYPDPLRVPDRLTDGEEAYTASVDVYWNKLPERHLTLPYIYCKYLPGDEGGVEMIEYPPRPYLPGSL